MQYRHNLIRFLNECKLKESLGVSFNNFTYIEDKFIKYNGSTFTVDGKYTHFTESMLDERHNQRIQA